MDRYVIVSIIKGAGGELNNNLRKDVFEKFRAKASTLPAHFTIKAPFEANSIKEVEDILEEFVKHHKAEELQLKGYGRFGERVVFMDVLMSKEGKAVHDELIENLMKVPYMKFDRKDGKDKKFHVTIASKNIGENFNDIWSYVNEKECDFKDKFNNISIYKWGNYKWELYKEYVLS